MSLLAIEAEIQCDKCSEIFKILLDSAESIEGYKDLFEIVEHTINHTMASVRYSSAIYRTKPLGFAYIIYKKGVPYFLCSMCNQKRIEKKKCKTKRESKMNISIFVDLYKQLQDDEKVTITLHGLTKSIVLIFSKSYWCYKYQKKRNKYYRIHLSQEVLEDSSQVLIIWKQFQQALNSIREKEKPNVATDNPTRIKHP